LESYGITSELINAAWENILEESLQLYEVKDGKADKYKHLLKTNLDIVGEAIRKSDINDPLLFFRSQAHGGEASDLILAGAISQVRPIAAMYLAFPAGSGEVEGFLKNKTG